MLALLFTRFTLRHWRSSLRQSVLLALILALGVAVYFSVRLANRAAVASFQDFSELITTQSDWVVSSPSGELPESALREVREALGDAPVHLLAVVETTGAKPRDPQHEEEIGTRPTWTIMGVDLVALTNFPATRRNDAAWFSEGPGNFWSVFANPRAVYISAALAEKEHLKPGSEFPLVVNEHVATLTVAGLIPANQAGAQVPETLLLMDLPSLQALAGREGRLDRIECLVQEGPLAAQARVTLREAVEKKGGDRWVVSSPHDRRKAAATMTQAFRLNLTLLSLLALLVGLYLIFQALDGAVVRRREEIGILRSLGVPPRMIQAAWLVEAAALGVVGGVAGGLLGWGGAQVSVRLVSRTVNALYYATSTNGARFEPGEFLLVVALAVVASVLAGWLPARAAAATPPAQLLVRHAAPAGGGKMTRLPWLGLAFWVVGGLLLLAPPLRLEGGGRFPWAGYVAVLCGVFGGGCLGASVLRVLARLLAPAGAWSLPLRLAASHLRRPSGRHGLAAACLLCAVTMTGGMAILVGSFDRTMRGWIDRTFHADLYISSDGAQSASTRNRISPATWQAIVARPEVAEAAPSQFAPVTVNGLSTLLGGVDLGLMHRRVDMAWVQEPRSGDIFDPAKNSTLALCSEAFSERFRLHRGDAVDVPTPAGFKRVTLAGVFADYGNERGSLLVERTHFSRWFGHEQLANLALFVKPGVSPDDLRASLLHDHPGLSVFTNSRLRAEILRIFRQTFSLTYALELIGVIVAVTGLGLTLASVLLERRAELTTLRALGLRHGEMARATAAEGAVLSLAGTGLGLALSLALGWILIFIINKQTFGWTLQFTVPWLQLAAFAALVLASGTTVAFLVGLRSARLPADREE